MSLESLHRERMYVLGPLELSPGNFAVGERSYIAIKGNMPYYNDMRQKFYLDGNTAAGDAIGELETRANTAETTLDKLIATKKAVDVKLKAAQEEIAALKKNLEESTKRDEDIRRRLEIEGKRLTRQVKKLEDKLAKIEKKETGNDDSSNTTI